MMKFQSNDFGGILLGAGGLVRAYSHTARLALDAAHIITYEQYKLDSNLQIM